MDDRYRALMKERPEKFAEAKEEASIRIITDETQISRVQEELGKEIGVIYEDDYILLLRDAVMFPDGNRGAYVRILAKEPGSAAVILPVVNGKILLLEHYRHSLREPMWEIPRGFGERGLSPEENARKELAEETGIKEVRLQYLGEVCPDSGMQGTTASIYMAQIQGSVDIKNLDEREAIMGYRLASYEELGMLVRQGKLKDGFTLSALALAMLQEYGEKRQEDDLT